ncbi:MAG: protein kinase [Acidobacteria bacterium]|nr:protein kinase [Acidobacteriota bacterium]
MRPSPETAFGHYRIISQLGAGGMGEVFLAEDTRLERKVALKILPEKFSVNSEGLNRFKQEAKAASALNHPNIITVYEIGEHDGTNFIATEFIDGKTLRGRLETGDLSFEEVLSIVIQTAEALAAAHAAGIVHRDIKPENIMIRPDGYVKVLDFGLAKLMERGNASAESEDATVKLVKTNPGVVMGTVAYMSPEQARGKDVDARSDIFSFGIVLYEMITGHTPFEGETMTDVLAAILNQEPASLISFVPDLPKELQRIAGKTLRKNREQRYQSTKDLLGDLKDLREELNHEAKLERSSAPNKSKISTSFSGNKDALLLTEFNNLTGDAVFDATLKMALAFSLEQSPYLEIFADERVRQTLRLMGYSSDERVTRELGKEICQRKGLKAFIAGTISNLGTTYVLTLEAVNTQTGETIGRQLEQAESKEQVLKALGQAASGLREKLGENIRSIEQFDAALELTTSSLEALKVFSLGFEQRLKGRNPEVIPFYKRAIELDPNFAYAYIELATIYDNTTQPKQAAEYVTKAFELRDRVSELEKLRITVFYYIFVTGELNKAIETLELYKQTYPRDERVFINLSDTYIRIGRFEKAIDAAHEALRLNSNNALNYINLGESLLHLNRFAEAKEVFERAFEQKLDNMWFYSYLYQIAFIENDTATMANQLAWFSGQAGGYVALNLQTGAAASQGQWRKSQGFSRRAIDLAIRSDAKAVAAQYAAEQALRIVFWSLDTGLLSEGDTKLKMAVKTQTNNALRMERNKVTLTRTALALAVAGQSAEANSLVDELTKEHPKDTLINELWLPTIRAASELQNGRAKEAIEESEITERFERAGEFYPQYIRGLAYLKLNKTKQAAAAFEKILKHRGEAPLSSIYPLAQLGKARATKDKAEYEKFFELWKEADKDMPALVEAKKEYDNLSR